MLFAEEKLDLQSPIKWAGGKKFIIDKIKPMILKNNDKKCFIECFGGSLALTLYFQPKKVIINDLNFPLINMWKIIKDYPEELCEKLEIYSNNAIYNNKIKFNEIKKDFNEMKMKNLTDEERILLAAYFIYLNKRSFNGLYRENKSGIYNVPFRLYKNCEMYNAMNIRNISKYFNENDVEIYNNKYCEIVIPKDSFVYLDPPYYPSDTSDFTQYTKDSFNIENQKELYNFCKELDKKRIKFIQSNSPCSEIIEMYSKFKKDIFYIHRSMRSAKEGTVEKDKEDNEILISN